MTSITWTGTNGDWDTAADWSSNPLLPRSSDAVSIDTTSAATITHDVDDADSIAGLATGANDLLEISNGSLLVSGAAAIDGGLATGGSESVGIVLDGTSSLSTLTMTGGVLAGTGSVTVAGPASITDGRLTGTATIDLQEGGTIEAASIDGGRVLQNDATLLVYDTIGLLGPLGYGAIDNSAGAVLDLVDGAAIGSEDELIGIFDNAGTLETTGSGTDYVEPALNDTGAGSNIQVDAGTLDLEGGGTSLNAFTVASGASAEFGGGTFTFSGGSYDAAGATIVSGGTVNLSDIDPSLNTLTVSGGTLNFGSNNVSTSALTQTNSTIVETGNLTVMGAASLGTGLLAVQTGAGTTDLQADGTIGYLALDGGRTLQNDATTTIDGTIYLGDNPNGGSLPGGTLDNSADGTMLVGSGSQTVITDGAGGRSFVNPNAGTTVFDNAGMIEMTGGSNSALYIDGVTFNNTGTVDVGNSDTLAMIGGSFTDSGSITGSGTIHLPTMTTLQNGSLTAADLTTGTLLVGFGTITATDIALGGTIEASGGTLDLGGTIEGYSPGITKIDTGAKLELSGTSNATVVFGGVGTLELDAPGDLTGTLQGLADGDVIEMKGQTITSATISGTTLAMNVGGTTYDYAVASGSPQGSFAPVSDSEGGTELVICFYPGTGILTPDGTRDVETLAIGDLVVTALGSIQPIGWIGRQTVSTRFSDPSRVLPIQIRAGALGENLPERDLHVSPAHALLIDNVLVHAGALVNGQSITRKADVPEVFTYYHIELDDHSLILAEGVPAETFIDNVDRMNFDNWQEHLALWPDGRTIPEMSYPRAKARRQVPMAIRQLLVDVALTGSRARRIPEVA